MNTTIHYGEVMEVTEHGTLELLVNTNPWIGCTKERNTELQYFPMEPFNGMDTSAGNIFRVTVTTETGYLAYNFEPVSRAKFLHLFEKFDFFKDLDTTFLKEGPESGD